MKLNPHGNLFDIIKTNFFPDKIQNCYLNRLNFQGGVFFGIGHL